MSLKINAKVEDGVWTGPPFIKPAIITDTFGNYPSWRKYFDHDGDPSTPPRDFGPHKGVDAVMPSPYQKIVAAANGTVWWVGKGHEVMGNFVIITHGEGADVVATYYLHLHSESTLVPGIRVKPGNTVLAGEVIGWEGDTGSATGRHLHFGVRVGDAFVDPMGFLVEEKVKPLPFNPPLMGQYTYTTYSGGTADELEEALLTEMAASAHITYLGEYLTLIPGAPDFVNESFRRLFHSVPAGRPMLVVRPPTT